MNTTRQRLAALLLATGVILAVAGCDSGNPTPTPRPLATGTAQGGIPSGTSGPVASTTLTPGNGSGDTDVPMTPSSREVVSFADYNLEPSSVNPSVAPYSVQPGLANVANAGDFKLSSGMQALIEKNAFAAQFPQGKQYKQLYELYQDFAFKTDPAFVTTDSLLHVYHLLFDKMLRSIESKYLMDELKQLNASMLKASQAQYDALKGTSAENAAKRNLAYFSVAARLLDPNASIPSDVQSQVSAEVDLIESHSGRAPSPVMNIGPSTEDPYMEDYSQYVPRGHYTRSEDLMRYFKAMMWYGRMTFRLSNFDETRSALLLTQALDMATAADGSSAADLWADIYDTTAFFVGGADDLTYRDYGPPMLQALGQGDDPKAVADDARVVQFQTLAQSLTGPRINSMFVFVDQDTQQVATGLRMMGQRFTLDEYVFGQLTYGKVGTPEKPRNLPKGLDVPASFGSTEAYSVLDAMGETQYANYSTQMDKVRGQIKSLPQSQWTQNLYWSWLYTFLPLLPVKAPDSGFPSFMTNPAWARKDLNTVLGSWTELKHDTILYAKQSQGAGAGPPPQPPKGYVEPEPEFYARVAALVAMTRDGLLARGLIVQPSNSTSPGDAQDYQALDTLYTLALNLKHISEKELSNQDLTDQEYTLIKTYGGMLENITRMASDSADPNAPNTSDLQDQDAAVVADVASSQDTVLEEGTGRFMEIYVVFPLDGKLYLGRGGIYSQYEFTQPAGNRLTDQQWQDRLNSGQAPDSGDWKTYIAK
jgi:hypothetical protein